MAERDSLFDAHVMVTDWSGAGQDFGLGLEKPVLFIDVPPKSRNDSWRELGIEPFESSVRDKIGAILPPDRFAEAPDLIRRLVRDRDGFRQRASVSASEWVFNLGQQRCGGRRGDRPRGARSAAGAAPRR